MIKINKCLPPKDLIDKGKQRRKKHCDDFDKNQEEYLNGKNHFDFDKIYRSDSVKDALYERQFNKCCFSEAKFVGDYPHVEHFRPKGRVDISETKEEIYPGYYWLAYEWSNLFYCKGVINSSYKRNFFPLYNEAKRNRNHHNSFIERNILIDPSVEDPREYIRFVRDEPKGIDKEGRGDLNIKLLGLRDHPSFVDDRSDKFIVLYTMKALVDESLAKGMALTDPILLPILNLLRESIKPEAEFSSMAIDLLQGWPHL